MRYNALAFLFAAACFVTLAKDADGQLHADATYPDKPVRLILQSSPASGVDIVGRIVAEKLSETLGQQVIVDNRPGAGGNLGAEIASKRPADGYTLFMATSAQAINPSLYKKLNYDIVRDFSPVSLITTGQYIVVIHPSLPARSVKELIALALSRPGELLYGSGGSGNATHLAVELFNSMAGTRMLHVPYKGSGPALIDLIGGQVHLMFANLTAGLPHVKSGRLRAIATTGELRSPITPSLPTIRESGLSGYVVTAYYAIFVPAGTPASIISRLNSDLTRVLRASETRKRLSTEGADPVGSTPLELAVFMKSEIVRWARVIKEVKIETE